MPAIIRSQSPETMLQRFEERRRAAKRESQEEDRRATEEGPRIFNIDHLVDRSREDPDPEDNVSLQCLATGENSVAPSDSEKLLLDHVLQKEKRSVRSKTSANKRDQEIIEMNRAVKSDSEYSAEVLDYPDIDIHGAGDPVNMTTSNGEEAVQIDIILEATESEHGDRSTVVTDALPSAEIDVDVNDDDDGESTSSEEDPENEEESESEEEYEEDNEDISKDLEAVAGDSGDSDSDETEETTSENGHCSSGENGDLDTESLAMDAESLEMDAESPDIDAESTEMDTGSLDINVDTPVGSEQSDSDDNDSQKSERGSESEQSFAKDDVEEIESARCGGVENYDDQSEPSQGQPTERSRDDYDPNSDDEYVASDDDSSTSTEEVDYVWIPSATEEVSYTWISCHTQGPSESFSGLRETFTPYQAFNDDDPGEGNRPEADIAETRETNAFQTRLHKTDGEGLVNIPLSMSFVMRNKDDCIKEGARTISELMIALQRKLRTEIAREEHEAEAREEHETGEREEHETEKVPIQTGGSRVRGTENAEGESDTTKKDPENSIDNEQRHEVSLESRQDTEVKAEPMTHHIEKDLLDRSVGRVSDAEAKPKKVSIKTPGIKPKLDTTFNTPKNPSNKKFPKKAQASMVTRSAAQPRITEPYAQNSRWKGPKPVLPAISKGISKSAGRVPPTKEDFRQGQSNRVMKTVDHRNPEIGNITVQTSSDGSTKHSFPRKMPLPSIPVQLQSNAYFRNGQLEVEVTCDDRTYSYADPMDVKVTVAHRHVPRKKVSKATKPSAYKANSTRKQGKLLNFTEPVNRNIIHQRALWPPFNTHLDAEASSRHKKIFGTL